MSLSLFSLIASKLYTTSLFLPFFITNLNVIVTEEKDGTRMATFNRLTSSGESIFLLKDVQQVGGILDKYTATIIENVTAFQNYVEDEIMNPDSKFEDVMYQIHGFQNQPLCIVQNAFNYNENSNTTSLQIPYYWGNPWYATPASYCISMCYAEKAGIALSSVIDAFVVRDSAYDQSLMIHSMGNYAFNYFIANLGNDFPDEPIFDNIYTAAPDLRYDIFSLETNPSVSSGGYRERESRNNFKETISSTTRKNSTTTFFEDINDGSYCRSREDDDIGFLITSLVKNHTYVLYNCNDYIMELAKTQTCYIGDKRLGLYGSEAEAITNQSDYFRQKVRFVDFSCLGMF